MTEGYVPRGMGDSTIMTVDDNVEVWVDGKKVDITENQDGWMISSGTWFKRLMESTGIKNLHEVKGVIRVLEKTDDPYAADNYIGTKMMQMTPHNRMEFKREGETEAFARVTGNGVNNSIIDVKTGKVIDHLSSVHTSKMTLGRFSEFYTVQSIPETSQKIIQAQEHSKTTAAFPVTWGELAMDTEILNDEKHGGKAFIKALRKHYGSITNEYLKAFQGFLNNPKSLRDELKQELQDGQVQTQFQSIIDTIGEDGKGVHHPSATSFWKEMIKKRFFTHGLFKMRQKQKGKATQLFFKPKVHLEIPKQSVSISQHNSTLVNHVTALVIRDNAWLKKYLLEFNKERAVKTKRIIENWGDLRHNDKMTALNQYLKHHKVELLLSRQPVAKLTGVVVRRLHSFVKSDHGETLFANAEDIINVFDGDWDGDKTMVEIITDNEVIDAFKTFRNGDLWKRKRKAVNLKILDNTSGATDMSNSTHVNYVINQISSAQKTIGMITNARNTMFSLGIKNFKLDLGTMAYRVFKPTDKVVLDYVNIKVMKDEENLNMTEDAWNGLYEQGDSIINGESNKEYTADDYQKFRQDYIVDNKINFHLGTTKEHELSILLQMAVDDSKFGFLGQIKINPDFVYSRLFKNNNGNSVASMMGNPRKNIKSAFNNTIQSPMNALKSVLRLMNFSPVRQGIDNTNQKQYDIYGLFSKSAEMARMLSHSDDTVGHKLGLKVAKQLSERKQKPLKGKWYIKLNENLTPQEEMLISIHMRKGKEDGELWVDGDLPIMFTDTANRIAHARATDNIALAPEMQKYLLNPANRKALSNATTYMDNFASDYFDLLDKIEKEMGLAKGGYDAIELRYDYNEPMALLTDLHIEEWNKLTKEEQVVATLYYLQGVVVKGRKPAYRLHIPPMKLLDKETMREYFKKWDEKVRQVKKGEIKTDPQPLQQARREAGIDIYEINNVNNQMLNTIKCK